MTLGVRLKCPIFQLFSLKGHGDIEMKKYLFLLMIIYSTVGTANPVLPGGYVSSHGFNDMNKSTKECLNIVRSVTEKLGFITLSFSGPADRRAISGKRKDGFSYQYVCVESRKIAYFVVNGLPPSERLKLSGTLEWSVQERLQKRK